MHRTWSANGSLAVFDFPAAAYDDATGLMWAVGVPPTSGAYVITIDPRTGFVTELAAVNIGNIQLCEAAFGPGPNGASQT